jgi:vitamin B12 transporter
VHRIIIFSGLVLSVFILCCLPALVCAQSPDNQSAEGAHVTSGPTTKEELLLFWDEKDLYVQSPTRHEKPISQAAENITVVTAKEIEDMNAHTVAEVLNRVTGVFVDFLGQDFGSASLIHIQNPIYRGGPERFALVLLDGVPWNTLASGHAETISIPVKIIERIEIIKGPASSSWGSSLGGIVNIITKEAGNSSTPSGTLSGSFGERDTQEYGADVSGKAGPVGYYLFAGKQESDGQRDNRYFRNESLYAKFRIPVSPDINVGFTAGYSNPRLRFSKQPSNDLTDFGNFRTFFATASLDAAISRELDMQLSLFTLTQKADILANVLGTGIYGPAGDLLLDQLYDERTTGGSARLVWKHDIQTAVLGFDMSHGSLDQTIDSGPFFQSIGSPAVSTSHPDIDKWAVYANDTIIIGKLSVTPGIRYDHNTVTGSFTSPSLGITYKLAEKTLVRASAARGFTIPPLSWTSGGGLFLDPNPSLRHEKVWSYQTGIESAVTDYLWAKATLFYHGLDNSIEKVLYAAGPPTFNDLFFNTGKVKRLGYEIDAETAPVYNFSLKAGFASVRMKSTSDIDQENEDTRNIYEYRLGIKYDDKDSLMAQLFGYYTWWDLDESAGAKYNAFIWDLNLRKKIYSTHGISTEAFFTAHNIFGTAYYTMAERKNPGRWIEAGVRIKF